MDQTVVGVCSGVVALASSGGEVGATPSVSGDQIVGRFYHSRFTRSRFVIISGHRQLKTEQPDSRSLSALLPLTKEQARSPAEICSSTLPGLHDETAKFPFSPELVEMWSHSVTDLEILNDRSSILHVYDIRSSSHGTSQVSAAKLSFPTMEIFWVCQCLIVRFEM
jgi:hypothetical protein